MSLNDKEDTQSSVAQTETFISPSQETFNAEVKFGIQEEVVTNIAIPSKEIPLFGEETGIERIAKLASLALTKEEEKLYIPQLDDVRDFVSKLREEVDAEDVEPTFNVTRLSNVMREDKTEAGLSQKEVLSNAPNKKNGMFVTKGVFKNDG